MVEWILDQIGMNTAPIKSLDTLKEWQKGLVIPTFTEIETVSKDTRIPLGYFFLQTPPQEKISLMEYRTLAGGEYDRPSRELVDTIADMEHILEWTRDYRVSDSPDVNPIVGKLKGETNIPRITSYIRQILRLSTTWFKETNGAQESFRLLRERMSEVGIIVMMNGIVRDNTHRPLDINEFRAFTLIDEYVPLIFINATDSASGKLFSLLHEFVHICLGRSNLFNDRYGTVRGVSKLETVCNAVAAEVLVPSSLFTSYWQTLTSRMIPTHEIIEKTAKFFRCGRIIIARKALDAGEINYEAYNETVQEAIQQYIEQKQKERDTEGGGDYYNTKGSRIDKNFLTMLVNSISQGKTQYSEAFRLTHTNRHTFSKLVERATV